MRDLVPSLIPGGQVPPLLAASRSRGFTVDWTPPDPARLSLSFSFPPRFNSQSGFPAAVSGLVLRVRLVSA